MSTDDNIKSYAWVVQLGPGTIPGDLVLSTGLLSKKLFGRSSNPPLKVGITGNSSWEGT
jgi:hypothetical protein